ncbi:hypothetical protein E2C01_036906 [Portunus trituberculatus]|uniref:Uncharacterized protein n=1 Tax=Portunus trituberculatus TaxID=210409 RepID=A0A5B7FDQ6_PORTR|nr:hypothetical protein [Portunus trituberculatus]
MAVHQGMQHRFRIAVMNFSHTRCLSEARTFCEKLPCFLRQALSASTPHYWSNSRSVLVTQAASW